MYVQQDNQRLKSLLVRSDALPAGVWKWNQKYDDLNWKNIFYLENVFKPPSTHSSRWFEIQLMHKILPTGRFLQFLYKITESPLCTFCNQQEETISHLIWGCTKSKSFWNVLQICIKGKCINSSNSEFSERFILFDVSQKIFTQKLLDLIVLLSKFYAYNRQVEWNCTLS